MRKAAVVAMFVALTFAVSPAKASIIFTLNSPSGDMGKSHTFTVSGVSLVAYAEGSASPDLWGKNDGADETGLGLTNDSDHEITSSDFVQVDFSNPKSQAIASAQFQMGSVQTGEGWALYGSNTLGTIGTKLMDSSSLTAGLHPEDLLSIPSFASYQYFSWTATAADVVLGEIQMPNPQNLTGTPEPGSLVLAGFAFVGLSVMMRRVRKSGSRRG